MNKWENVARQCLIDDSVSARHWRIPSVVVFCKLNEKGETVYDIAADTLY